MYFPACCLGNQNIHWFLNPGQMPTPAIHKKLVLKVSYPNSQSTPIYSLYLLEGNWLHTLIWLRHNITQLISKSASSPCADLLTT